MPPATPKSSFDVLPMYSVEEYVARSDKSMVSELFMLYVCSLVGKGFIYVSVSLTGDLPSVQSGRQGICVCVSLSLPAIFHLCCLVGRGFVFVCLSL